MIMVIVMEAAVPPSEEDRVLFIEELDTQEQAEAFVADWNANHLPIEGHDWFSYAFIEE